MFKGLLGYSPLSLRGVRVDVQAPNKAISNESNGQEVETAAAERKVTPKNFAHRQKSTHVTKFFILSYG